MIIVLMVIPGVLENGMNKLFCWSILYFTQEWIIQESTEWFFVYVTSVVFAKFNKGELETVIYSFYFICIYSTQISGNAVVC